MASTMVEDAAVPTFRHTGGEHGRTSGADEDLYLRYKRAQRALEMLEIQVRGLDWGVGERVGEGERRNSFFVAI